jgi:Phytanoyl-CoA dioxygenase (PhyH)
MTAIDLAAAPLSPMPAPMPAPMAISDAQADLSSVAFWAQLNPRLHVGHAAFVQRVGSFQLDDAARTHLGARMQREGYLQYHVPPADWQIDLEAMADCVRGMVTRGGMPAFAFVYDEFWLLFLKQARLLSHFLGADYRLLPDFWAWHVDPSKGENGWRPHRDKGVMALRADGSPKSLTCWIPLTDATPLNGCMYMVPADRDPTYGTAQDKEWKFQYTDIRALPSKPGDVFMWNQAVLHWGSHTSPFAADVRISAAFEFQRADEVPFNTPLLPANELPSLQTRLLLIAKQVLQYRHMYRVPAYIEQFSLRLLVQAREQGLLQGWSVPAIGLNI